MNLQDVLESYDLTPRRKMRCFSQGHEDRVASLSLDLEHDQWFCHACNKGGGPVQAIMAIEGIEYAEALERAAVRGLGGDDTRGGEERGRSRRVPKGKGYKPRYRRHIPAWRGSE